jgi:hypothetical protein
MLKAETPDTRIWESPFKHEKTDTIVNWIPITNKPLPKKFNVLE